MFGGCGSRRSALPRDRPPVGPGSGPSDRLENVRREDGDSGCRTGASRSRTWARPPARKGRAAIPV